MAVIKFTCPNCSSLRAVTAMDGDGDRPPMVRCIDCNAEMFWPIPTASELASYYGTDNFFSRQGREIAEQYLADPHPTRNSVAGLAAELDAFGTPRDGVVVDLGCSYGVTVIELRRLGYDAWGVELSAEGIAFLNRHGGKGYCGTILDHNCPLTRIDAVFSSHTFEHMPNPYAAFRKLHRLMRPGGFLTIALPHWGGLVAQHLRARWKWCGYPAHIHYFRVATLPAIVTGLGFKVVSIDTTFFPFEADDVLDAFDVAKESRTAATADAISSMLRNGKLGEALILKAVRA
jgi:SAM-dependent methyltransferase